VADKRESAKPEEGLSLSEILKVSVSDERVERLKKLTSIDAEGVSDEVFTWLVRQQATWANIQYTRFLAGAKFTEQDVDELLVDAIDCHTHGGSDPMERLLLDSFRCNELHRGTLYRLGDRLGIAEVVLLPPGIGANIFRRHQTGIMSERFELPT